MRIKEEFKKSGYFWLPSVPDRKVPGILSISDGGSIDLEIIELLDHKTERLFNNSLKRIVGYIQEDGFVTLDNCSYKGGTLASIGLSESSFRVTRVFTRVQYDEGETPSFNTLTFSVEGVDDWIGISNDPQTTTILYQHPESISFNLTKDIELSITFNEVRASSWSPREERITQKTYFKLVLQDARELGELVSVARKITEFLCFATNKIVCLDSMSATSDDLTQETGDGKTAPVPINIYYQSWPYAKDEPKINLYNMLFDFKEIQNDADGIINNWIKGYEQYDSAFRLYFLGKIGGQTYLEERFITLAHSLEVYHRRTSKEKQMAKAEFEKLVESLIEQCPEKRRKWLEGKLKYGNEISLRKRITRLIEPFKELFGNKKKRKKLINGITDTRNYLTHYDPCKESQAAKGQDLWILCLKMELLLELHFLQLMGFSGEKIDSIIDNCPELKRKRNW